MVVGIQMLKTDLDHIEGIPHFNIYTISRKGAETEYEQYFEIQDGVGNTITHLTLFSQYNKHEITFLPWGTKRNAEHNWQLIIHTPRLESYVNKNNRRKIREISFLTDRPDYVRIIDLENNKFLRVDLFEKRPRGFKKKVYKLFNLYY